MRSWKRYIIICFFVVGLILIIWNALISFSFRDFSSDFSSLNEEDYKNFSDIGKDLFLLYDSGYITTNKTINPYDYEDKPKLRKALSKYKSIITRVHFVDSDVILIPFGAVFQSIDGIAIRRNNAELKDTYENTGFDTGTLYYTELIPNVYHFTAGL